ncbi:hypothetical protein DOY81_007210, partial [Sarcophaga bullata]
MLKPKGFNIDKLWFVKARNKGISLSGTFIRNKVKEIAEKLNYVDFSVSSGWLERLKKRHNITFRAISGKPANVNQEEGFNIDKLWFVKARNKGISLSGTFIRSKVKMVDTNSALDLLQTMNWLRIVYFIHKAWEQASAEILKNCLRKAGFRKNYSRIDNGYWTAEAELLLSALAQFSYIVNRVQSQIQVDVEDYINLDNDIVINDEDVESTSTEMFSSEETVENSSENELENEIDDNSQYDCVECAHS